MKANEFVKKHGWDSLLIAKRLLKFDRYKYVIFYTDEIDFSNEFHVGRESYMFEVVMVKRLVESHELVERNDGIESAKMMIERTKFPLSDRIIRLKRAIADVESCTEVS